MFTRFQSAAKRIAARQSDPTRRFAFPQPVWYLSKNFQDANLLTLVIRIRKALAISHWLTVVTVERGAGKIHGMTANSLHFRLARSHLVLVA